MKGCSLSKSKRKIPFDGLYGKYNDILEARKARRKYWEPFAFKASAEALSASALNLSVHVTASSQP